MTRPGASDETSSSSGSLLSSLKISSDSSSLATLEGSIAIGRGATRGKRDRADLLHMVRTRPETCLTKTGTDGVPVTVASNYFAMIRKTNWRLLQYRVDFNPPLGDDMTRVRFFF